MRYWDLDTDLENLVRRWHSTNELCTAAWSEFLALGDALSPAGVLPRLNETG